MIKGWLLWMAAALCVLLVQGCAPSQDAEQERVIALLVQQLQEESVGERIQAAEQLGRFGEDAAKAVPELVVAVTEDDVVQVRRAAARALGAMGAAAVPELLGVPMSPEVALALGLIGTEDVRPALLAAFVHDDPQVRSEAVQALERLGMASEGDVPGLAEALLDPATSSEAARILASVHPTTSRELLATVLQDENLPDFVLLSLAEAGAGLVPLLIECLQSQDRILQSHGLLILGSMGPSALDAAVYIRPLLTDPEAELSFSAIWALGEMGPAAAPVLLAGLHSPSSDVRLQTASKLAAFGGQARSTLLLALDQQEGLARLAVLGVLNQIGLSDLEAAKVTQVQVVDDDRDYEIAYQDGHWYREGVQQSSETIRALIYTLLDLSIVDTQGSPEQFGGLVVALLDAHGEAFRIELGPSWTFGEDWYAVNRFYAQVNTLGSAVVSISEDTERALRRYLEEVI